MPVKADRIRFYLVSLPVRVIIVVVIVWADIPDGGVVRCLQTR